jgi:hypothetical protein
LHDLHGGARIDFNTVTKIQEYNMRSLVNTDTLDSLRLNELRRNAQAELVQAIDHALRCGSLNFEQATRMVSTKEDTAYR